ncbi:MAG: hypothetical protein COA93_09205, partial [Alphaproteobacteria bacterium]
MKLGDISVSYIEIMLKAMAHLGVEVDEILDKYSIDSTSLASPDARVSIPKFMRLGHDCIQASGLPWFGLVMGEVTTVTNLGIAGLLALSAQDLRQACHQIATFELLNKYNSRGQSQFFVSQAFGMDQDKYRALSREYGVEQGQGVLMFYSIKPYNDYNYFVVDSVLSGWCQIIQDLSGCDDGIEKVCFEFPAPVYAAKALATLDHASHGRAGLNMVCGWNQPEFDMFGLTKPDQVYDQGKEWFEILRRTLSGEAAFDFKGDFFDLKGVCGAPGSMQTPH